MGTKIASADIARERLPRGGSIELEAEAARGCLRKADVNPKHLGILINTGIYRDGHMMEPAISSFIQRKIGANEEFDGNTSTFSFDLSNGGCGMLTGIMVADGFLCSGLTQYGMVVSGDAEPVPGESAGYSFEPAAAAILLTPGSDGEGFVAFKTYTETRYLESFRGRIEWPGEDNKLRKLVLQSSATYASECAHCAVHALKSFLEETMLTLEDVDLLLPSQSPPGFVAEVRTRTGLGNRIVDVTDEYGNVHTAGIGMALDRVLQDGRFARSRHVVFLATGAGIVTSLALYVAA